MKEKYKNYLNNEQHFDKSTMLGIIALIIVIAGVFGFLYEVVFYYFNSGMTEIYWRGGNFMPWINIYAFGALIIYFLTFKRRRKPLQVFFISLISTGVLEYIGGFFMEYIMKIKCWDYSKEAYSFFDINGYVCIRSVLVFAISGLLLIYIVIPFIYYLAKKMKKSSFLILSYSLCAVIVIDEVYNLIFAKLLSWPKSTDIYKSLGFKYLYFN